MRNSMQAYVAARAPHLAPAPLVHIHQGGTTNAYCGQPLTMRSAVAWEQAADATCTACTAAFGGVA